MDEPLIPKDRDPLAPPPSEQQQQQQHFSPAVLHERARQQIQQVERLYLDRDDDDDVYWNGNHDGNTNESVAAAAAAAAATSPASTNNLSVVWGAAGAAGAVVNLCSATLGAGILSLPYSFYQAGLIAGMLLLIFAAIATATSISLLTAAVQHFNTTTTTTNNNNNNGSEAQQQHHHHRLQLNTYEHLTQHLLGMRCKLLVQVCLVVFCGGCAVAYCIAVGDILQLSGLLLQGNKAASIIAIWTIAMLPLSLLKTMKSLQCSSAIGMASVATLVFAAAVHLLQDRSCRGKDGAVPDTNNATNSTCTYMSWWQWNGDGNDIESMIGILWESRDNGTDTTQHDWKSLLWPAKGALSVLQACPIILFAFSCQVNVFAIYEELPCCQDHDEPHHHHKKLQLMQRVTVYAVLVCAVLYCSISCLGLADFGYQLDPNILNNYAPPVGIMQVACGSMAAAVIMAFPLNIFPARVTLKHVWNELHEREDEREPLCEPNETLTAALLEDLDLEISTQQQQQEQDIDEHEAGATTNDIMTSRVRFATPETTTIPPETNTLDDDDDGEDDENWQQHIILTLLLAGSALCLALVVPDIAVVFGLLGGTTSSVLGFCIPGALGLRLVQDQRGAEASTLWGTWLASWVLLIGGILLGIVTTVVTVYTTLF